MDVPPNLLRSTIYHRQSWQNAESIQTLLATILDDKRFAATHCGVFEPLRKLTSKHRSEVETFLSSGNERLTSRKRYDVIFERKSAPSCQIWIECGREDSAEFFQTSCTLDIAQETEAPYLANWLTHLLNICQIQSAWYAYIALNVEYLQQNTIRYKGRFRNGHIKAAESVVGVDLIKHIPGLYWGNYFGPAYVEWFGADTFKQLPSASLKWLDNGAVFFTLAEHPNSWASATYQQTVRTCRTMLGTDAFFDKERLQARLAEMGPVAFGTKLRDIDLSNVTPNFPFIPTPNTG